MNHAADDFEIKLKELIAALRLQMPKGIDLDIAELADSLRAYVTGIEVDNLELTYKLAQRGGNMHLYENLFHNAPVAFCTLDCDLKVVDANSMFLSLMSIPITIVRGNTLDGYFAHHSLTNLNEHLSSAKEFGAAQSPILELSTSSPPTNIQIFTSTLQVSGTHQFLFCILSNVTREVTSWESLARNEARLCQLLNSSDDIIFTLDREQRHTGVYGKWLDRMNQLPSDYIGKTVEDIFPKESSGVHVMHNKRALMGESVTYEWTFHNPMGDKHYQTSLSPITDANNGIVGVVGIGREITSQRVAEELLRMSEERYRTLVESANDIIYTLNPSGIFTYISPNWTHQLGYAVEESVGNSFQPYVHPDDLAKCQSFLDYVLTTRKRQSGVEYRVRHANGSWRWHQSNASARLDAQGRVVEYVGIAHDITEAKNRELMRLLLIEVLEIFNDTNNISDSITNILTAIRQRTELDAVAIRLRKGNDFPYSVHEGFSNDFLLAEGSLLSRDRMGGVCTDEHGRPKLECTCGLVLSGQTDPTSPYFTTGGSFWINNTIPLLDLPGDKDPRFNPRNVCIHSGYHSVALIPIRANNQMVGLLQLNGRRRDCFTLETIQFLEGLGLSIGAALLRQKAEEAINERNKELQCLYSITALGNDTQKSLNSYLLECLDLIPNGFAHSEHTVVRITIGNETIQSKGFVETPKKLYSRISLTPPNTGGIELFCLKPNCDENSYHFGNDEQKLLEAIANHIAHTIKRFSNESEISQQYDKLQALNAEKDKLFSVIGHDLRGPLASIITATNILESMRGNHNAQRKHEIISGVARLASSTFQLLENLLEWATFQKGIMRFNPQEVRIVPLVNDVIELYEQQLRAKSISLNLDVPAHTVARVDPKMFQSVIMNLVSNAIKFSNRKGEISISSSSGNEGFMVISISDSGIGMEQKLLDNLFRIDYSTGREGTDGEPSTGIGLLLCKGFVEQHGGRIWAESRVGVGSTFYVSFPSNT